MSSPSDQELPERVDQQGHWAQQAEAALPERRWREEVDRGLAYGLPGADSITDKNIPTFARGEIPHFAGEKGTFLKCPYVEDVHQVGDAEVAIFGAPLDAGTTYRPGTRFGPQGIRRATNLFGTYNYEMGVDLREQLNLVDIGDDGDAGFACPACGLCRSVGIVSIDVQRACIDDPFALQVLRLQDEAFIAPSQHRAFAAGVDQDQRLRTSAALHGDQLGFDAGVQKLFAMKGRSCIVAQLADVARLEPPLLAGNNRRSNLAAWKNSDCAVFGLRAALGKVFERNDSVSCIQADTDQVDAGRRCLGLPIVAGTPWTFVPEKFIASHRVPAVPRW